MNRSEHRKISETMDAILLPLIPHLKEDEAERVSEGLRIIRDYKPEEEEQEPVLDKIRTEINGKYRVVLKDTPKDDWAVRWNDCINEVLEIIDKYRESEVSDADIN